APAPQTTAPASEPTTPVPEKLDDGLDLFKADGDDIFASALDSDFDVGWDLPDDFSIPDSSADVAASDSKTTVAAPASQPDVSTPDAPPPKPSRPATPKTMIMPALAQDISPLSATAGPPTPQTTLPKDDPPAVLELGGPDAPPIPKSALPKDDPPAVFELGGPDAPSIERPTNTGTPTAVLELGGPDAPSIPKPAAAPPKDNPPAVLELGGPDAPPVPKPNTSDEPPAILELGGPDAPSIPKPNTSDEPPAVFELGGPDAPLVSKAPQAQPEPSYQVSDTADDEEEFPSIFDEVRTPPPETLRINSDGTLKPPPPAQRIKAMVPGQTTSSTGAEPNNTKQPHEGAHAQGQTPPHATPNGHATSEAIKPIELVDVGTLELEVITEENSPNTSTEEELFDPDTAAALKRYRPWVRQLGNHDPAVVSDATEQLLSSSGMALPALLEQFPGPIRLDHYSYTVSKLPPVDQHGPLLSILVQLGDLAAPAIVTFFEHPSVEIRFYSTFYFTRVRYEPVLSQMVRRLFDRDSQIRGVARLIIRSYRGSGGYTEVVRQIHYILHSSRDTWMLEQAALAIGALAETRAVPQLIATLENPNHRVADSVHRALCQITFEDMGKNRRKWERWWSEHGQESRSRWLVEALNHGKRHIRELAAEELNHMPGLLVNYSPNGPRPQRLRAQQIVAQYLRELSGR
ncbi:MAG: hypothetical protein AAFS10_19475, partial [Myxococcota bacterium]